MNQRRLHSPTNPGPSPGKSDAAAQSGTVVVLRLFEAINADLAAIHERLDRLETDVRNLRSRSSNRS